MVRERIRHTACDPCDNAWQARKKSFLEVEGETLSPLTHSAALACSAEKWLRYCLLDVVEEKEEGGGDTSL
jgi:hypothetical protein